MTAAYSLADQVPQEFIADREKLRGAKFDVPAMTAAIPQMRDQFRAHVQWIEAQLADGRPWMSGNRAGLCDVNAYMNIWYVRAHLQKCRRNAGWLRQDPRKGSAPKRRRPRPPQRNIDRRRTRYRSRRNAADR
jgi:glutathione S-transferase